MKNNVTGSRSRSTPLLLVDAPSTGPISRHGLQRLTGAGLRHLRLALGGFFTSSAGVTAGAGLSTMQRDIELTEEDRDRIQEIREDFKKDMEKVMA